MVRYGNQYFYGVVRYRKVMYARVGLGKVRYGYFLISKEDSFLSKSNNILSIILLGDCYELVQRIQSIARS